MLEKANSEGDVEVNKPLTNLICLMLMFCASKKTQVSSNSLISPLLNRSFLIN